MKPVDDILFKLEYDKTCATIIIIGGFFYVTLPIVLNLMKRGVVESTEKVYKDYCK